MLSGARYVTSRRMSNKNCSYVHEKWASQTCSMSPAHGQKLSMYEETDFESQRSGSSTIARESQGTSQNFLRVRRSALPKEAQVADGEVL